MEGYTQVPLYIEKPISKYIQSALCCNLPNYVSNDVHPCISSKFYRDMKTDI